MESKHSPAVAPMKQRQGAGVPPPRTNSFMVRGSVDPAVPEHQRKASLRRDAGAVTPVRRVSAVDSDSENGDPQKDLMFAFSGESRPPKLDPHQFDGAVANPEYNNVSVDDIERRLRDSFVYSIEARGCTDMRLAIDPRAGFMKRWDVLMIILISYVALVTPFEIGYLGDATGFLLVLNRSVDVLFGVDMIVNFFLGCVRVRACVARACVWLAWVGALATSMGRGANTLPVAMASHARLPGAASAASYFDEHGQWEFDNKKIARHYLKGWFIIDLLSVIPFSLIGDLSGSSTLNQLMILRLIRLLRLIKLARVIRASRLFKRWEMNTDVSYSTMAMFKHMVVTIVSTHWVRARALQRRVSPPTRCPARISPATHPRPRRSLACCTWSPASRMWKTTGSRSRWKWGRRRTLTAVFESSCPCATRARSACMSRPSTRPSWRCRWVCRTSWCPSPSGSACPPSLPCCSWAASTPTSSVSAPPAAACDLPCAVHALT